MTSPEQSATIALTHQWFEHHSGWAPPDVDTLDEWIADGVCRCPDECLVNPDGVCEHGLASWRLILDHQALDDRASADERSKADETARR